MSVIALLTDFGYRDGFVGAVKGVIKSINSGAEIIDISHGIESFNILEGALVLNATYRYFPEKTVFVCVVDPGVGTERKPIAVETKKYYFVAPDNGILSLALKNEKVRAIYHISNERYLLERDTETFHGRDIFAPAAAYISKGVKLSQLGDMLRDYKRIKIPEVREDDGYVVGEIIMFDKFGNGITNISSLPEEFKDITVKNFKIKSK
ncbi:MAG: SAM-dependent chlorinase/fluorinase [Persephonella sp.]|nr:SAM-dependent chlorinase/fluorinase [Persephonella sp.]